MNKYIYTIGASVLALAMSGLPAIALAEDGGGDATAQVGVQAGVTARVGEGESSPGEQQKQDAEALREQQKQQLEASSSDNQNGDQNVQSGDQGKQEIDLELEDDSNPATSFEDLQQKIEVRKHQLEQEVASTTEADKNIVENANQVRLAVHALLASKELIGGIGSQVSEIAKQMNDSVATTTNAEAKIQSRGFLTRFFFGGDSTSADIIAQEAAQNQQRIDDLTKLLAQANVPADVQATLNAQITALKDAQMRLQTLAESEQKAWGLFSWRF
ncbi:hypothetical protein KGQ72_01855 [Patescibacteria group bacterium]|nr:hypothetical protein [Patescibacteria group bacterium]